MIRTGGCLAAYAALLGVVAGCRDRQSVVVSAVRGTLTATVEAPSRFSMGKLRAWVAAVQGQYRSANRLAEKRRVEARSGLTPQRGRANEVDPPPQCSGQRSSGWTRFTKADIAGGFAGAIVTLAFALSLGVLSFAALGSQGAAVGIEAGCTAVLWGQLVAWLAGGTLPPGSAPRASTSLVLASFVAALAQDPAFALSPIQGPERLLAAVSLCVVLSGIFQLAFAALRLTQVVRYVPYPLIAGFMCGIAVLVLISQFGLLTGIARDGHGGLRMFEAGTLIVGLVTIGACFAAQHRVKRVPALAIGVGAGCAAYFAIGTFVPQLPLGGVVGPVTLGLPLPLALTPLADVGGADLARVLPVLGATAALIAVFGTLDTLFAGTFVDQGTNGRHNPRREVIAHGLANIASGAFGGVPVVYSVACAMAACKAGSCGGRRLSVTLAIVVSVLFAGAPAIAQIPLVVLAGVILVSSAGLVDRWVRELVARLPRDAAKRDATRMLSLATVAMVALATVTLGFFAALAIGLVLCVTTMMVGMNKALIRSVASATLRPSRRHWSVEDNASVQVARSGIKIVELEGPLFFGNAERLAAEVEHWIGIADVVILELRYVTLIDATAALLIERLARRASAGGSELVLAGVTLDGRHGRAFIAHSAFVDPVGRRWFHDADRAIEWAERRSLHRSEPTRVAELPVTALPLVKDLVPEQQAIVARLLQRIEAGRARFIFHENDPGDAVYLIARGAVEIALMNPEGYRTRIATIEAGSLFGEMALLDGGARSATAVATEPTVLYRLSRSALLEELPVTHPLIAHALLVAMMRHASQRLRETTRLVRQMDDARGC